MKRRKNESFSDYKARRAMLQYRINQFLRGRIYEPKTSNGSNPRVFKYSYLF